MAPGQPIRPDGSLCFRSKSPVLANERIYECPKGMLMRKHPWVFSVLRASVYADASGLEEISRQSEWLQRALMVIRAEKHRLHDERAKSMEKERESRKDASYARKVIRGNRRG